jgi:hypothetical protein
MTAPMAFPYLEVFLVLLVLYVAYSIWARLDSRLPIVGGLILLVVAAVIDAAGRVAVANTLTDYVFLLLAGGVLLLLVDHVRSRPGGARAPSDLPRGPTPTEGESGDSTDEWQGPAE